MPTMRFRYEHRFAIACLIAASLGVAVGCGHTSVYRMMQGPHGLPAMPTFEQTAAALENAGYGPVGADPAQGYIDVRAHYAPRGRVTTLRVLFYADGFIEVLPMGSEVSAPDEWHLGISREVEREAREILVEVARRVGWPASSTLLSPPYAEARREGRIGGAIVPAAPFVDAPPTWQPTIHAVIRDRLVHPVEY
jgi:hypothetical protein